MNASHWRKRKTLHSGRQAVLALKPVFLPRPEEPQTHEWERCDKKRKITSFSRTYKQPLEHKSLHSQSFIRRRSAQCCLIGHNNPGGMADDF
jgi:hypothetical protein